MYLNISGAKNALHLKGFILISKCNNGTRNHDNHVHSLYTEEKNLLLVMKQICSQNGLLFNHFNILVTKFLKFQKFDYKNR